MLLLEPPGFSLKIKAGNFFVIAEKEEEVAWSTQRSTVSDLLGRRRKGSLSVRRHPSIMPAFHTIEDPLRIPSGSP